MLPIGGLKPPAVACSCSRKCAIPTGTRHMTTPTDQHTTLSLYATRPAVFGSFHRRQSQHLPRDSQILRTGGGKKWGCQAAVSAQTAADTAVGSVERLKRWLVSTHGISPQQLKLEFSAGMYSASEDFRTTQTVKAGEVILELPADLGITANDALSHPAIAELAEGRSELVCLALWLIAERAKGSQSDWQAFLASLPQQTESPILWADEERRQLLRGSPVAQEAAQRATALEAEWKQLEERAESNRAKFPASVYNQDAFFKAMSVVLGFAAFLDSAQCFALVPLATLLRRTGREDAAQLDFDLDRQTATLTAAKSYGQGEQVRIFDGRPNGELFLATGDVEDANPSDCLTLQVGLVRADRMFSAKKQILESMGLSETQEFPIYEEKMPLGLLSYLRLSRIQDPAQLAMVSFERDTVVSQNNEYEILQLLMGDCRERLSLYSGNIEDDVKRLQSRDMSRRERLATQLLLSEKKILQGTVDAVRKKLAPIRGLPTKSGGMSNPNQDLEDIFATFENIPKAPGKLLGGIMSWARGDQDPTWTKKGGKAAKRRR